MKTKFDLSTKTFNQLRTLAAAKGFKGKNPTRATLEAFLKPAKRNYVTVGRNSVAVRRDVVLVAVKEALATNGEMKMADLYRGVLAQMKTTGTPTLWNDLGLVLKRLETNGRVVKKSTPGHRGTYVLIAE